MPEQWDVMIEECNGFLSTVIQSFAVALMYSRHKDIMGDHSRQGLITNRIRFDNRIITMNILIDIITLKFDVLDILLIFITNPI